MALSAWPLITAGDEADKIQSGQRTVPCVKYECATSFTNGMNVAIDRDGLLSLIQASFIRDALFMTTKLLSNLGQGIGMMGRQSLNSPLSLEFWSCRFQLMMALRMHNQLLEELSAFGELDLSDLMLPSSSNGQQTSMVPFALRLLHAEAPSFSPLPYLSIVRVHKLIKDTEKAVEIARLFFAATESEIGIWHERLEEAWMAKARVLFRLKEYSTAFDFYEWIMANAKSTERRANVLRMLLLMAMHIGDEQKLVKYMNDALYKSAIAGDDDEFPAFKAVFDGDYSEALVHLQKMKAHTSNVLESDAQFCNNEAICLLYSGKPVECVQSLFNHRDSCDIVTEPLALNVATVSDLVSPNSAALKQSFLDGRAKDPSQQRQQQPSILFNPAEVMRMDQ